MIPQKTYHFSVDDVFKCLIEVADKKMPLFEHPFFAFLKTLHNRYGAHVSLYLFYEATVDGSERTLEEIPDLKAQLAEEKWLSFGPHALNYETPPYQQSPEEQVNTFEKIYAQIERFVGKAAFSDLVRLQYYSESFELAKYFKEKGVKALFSTDRQVGTHRMPKSVALELLEKGAAGYNGMDFIRTMFRVEFFAEENLSKERVLERFNQAVKKYGFLIFYSHEVDMTQEKGRVMAKLMFEAADFLGLKSA